MPTYELFKQAATSAMESRGASKDVVQGFFKQAEELHQVYSAAIESVEKHIPEFRKLALCEALVATEMQKLAAGEDMPLGGSILDLFNRVGSSDIGKWLGDSELVKSLGGLGGEGGIGGMLTGGGAGMLGGLLLHALFDIPLPTAMLLGTLVGGGAGGLLGGTQGGQNMLFNATQPAAPKAPAPKPAPAPTTPPAPRPTTPVAANAPQPTPGQTVVPPAAQQLNQITGLNNTQTQVQSGGPAPKVTPPATLSSPGPAAKGNAPVVPPPTVGKKTP